MAYMLPPYPPFESNTEPHSLGTRWRKWLRRFTTFLGAMDITSDERKRSLLLHYMGEHTNDIFDTLPNTGSDYDSAIQALNLKFAPMENEEFEIYVFRQIRQQKDEILEQFHMRLRKASTNCNFTNIDKEIKSQIIMGCSDSRLRKHALRTPQISLNDLLIHGQMNETSERHNIVIEGSTGGTVNAIAKCKQEQHAKNFKVRQQRSSTQLDVTNKTGKKLCAYCGENWHTEGLSKCKARGQKCNKCRKLNHFSKVCKQKPRQTALTVEEEREEYIFSNRTNEVCDDDSKITLNICGTNIKFLIDTGATVNLISKQDYQMLKLKPFLLIPQHNIYAYGSRTPMNIVGTTSIKFRHKNNPYVAEFHITHSGPSLLGKKTAIALNVVQFIQNVQHETMTQDVEQYKSIFKGVGKHKTAKIMLHIDKSVRPTYQKHRRIPFHVRQKVEDELKQLEADDIIERVPSTEPTPWVSPIVIIPKKSAGEIRICVDMRAANLAIQRERHITPTIDDIMCDLNGSIFFSKLDLSKGYHQLELDPASRQITTFSTHIGLYRYKRLSFGVNAAAEIFQNVISMMLQDIPGTMNISDDILIFGDSLEKHNESLHKTLQRIKDNGLTLNKDKCVFTKRNLRFFGYIFSEKGITADPDKIRAITEMHTPTTPTEVRSFLGMTGFCARFIPNLSETSSPLRDLTKKNAKWDWSGVHQKAVDRIKEQLAQATTTTYFNRSLNTEVWTDASPTGLGAIMIQRTEAGKPQVIAYASHALSPTETRYSQIEREALAIVWAVEHFNLYLYGSSFKIMTDHRPLVPLFNNTQSKLSARLERWRLRLQKYTFEVEFQPGKDNPADYMSRHPLLAKETTSVNRAEVYINFVANNAIPKAITIKEVQECTKVDVTLQSVIQRMRSGNWSLPMERNVNESDIQAFKKVSCELSTNKENNILLRGARLVLPQNLQQRALEIAHGGHQGIVKTKALIREKIWFVGIDKKVETMIQECLPCNITADSNTLPPVNMTEIPEHPWETIHIDHKGPLPSGDYLLVLIDSFSRFPIVEIVSSTSAAINIPKLDSLFSVFGIPKTVCTDNGPPFTSHEFRMFAEEQGFHHRKITPLWPRANGEVERFNKTLNKALQIANACKTNWRQLMNKLLANYRATPHGTTGSTPHELMFGYKVNTKLPDIRHIKSPIDVDSVTKRDTQRKQQIKQQHDTKCRDNQRQPQIGDTVVIRQNRINKLTPPFGPELHKITEIKGNMITSENDKHKIVRNQSHIKIVNNHTPLGTTEEDSENSPKLDFTQLNQDDGQANSEKERSQILNSGHIKRQCPYNLRTNIKKPSRLIMEA